MSKTMQRIPEQTTIKTPGTRLLDLLAGWGNFIDDERKAPDVALNAEEIALLYQQAAAEVMSLSGDDEAEAVQQWVMEKILPALLRTSVPHAAMPPISVAA